MTRRDQIMNPEELIRPAERVDDLQLSGLSILQDPERFCFGMDAVLLSGFVEAKRGTKVLDLGTGTGIIPILLSAKTEAAHLTGLEIQSESADMARRSVLLNNLEKKIDIVTGDLREAVSYFEAASFDIVTCNPPYMIADHGIANPESAKAIARHEVKANLEDVVHTAAKMLKSSGSFYMVHRPFRLAEIIMMLGKYHLEPERMRLVHPYVDKEPNMVLIQAVKGGKPRITVEKPLIVYDKPGEYSQEMKDNYGY